MADEQKFSARANFEWPPKRYYNYAAYVMMFNGVVNDHDSYGIDNSNGDQVILAYIKDHLEELAKKPEFEFIYNPDNHPEDFTYGIDRNNPNKFKYKTLEEAEQAKKKARENFDKELKAFKTDIDNFHAQAKEDSGKLNGYQEGGFLKNFVSNEQMAKVILPAKRKTVRSWHEAVRRRSKGKSGDYDMDGGKESNGEHYIAYMNAMQKRRDLNTQVRRNGARTFFRSLATIAAAGVTVASVGALLSFGGLALSSIFGVGVKGIGGAVLGIAGTVIGGAFTKGFFGRFLDSWIKGKSLRKQRREFMKSYGSGADKDGKAQGFKNIEQRYAEDLFLKYALEKLPMNETQGKQSDKALKDVIKGFKKEYPEFKKHIDRAFRRGDLPLKPKELIKEAGYYRFVTDKYNPSKRNYGFEYIIGKLGNAKSMNLNDSHSVQAETVIARDRANGSSWELANAGNYVGELIRAKEKFKGDNETTYSDLSKVYSGKTLDAFRTEIFDRAYTTHSYVDIGDALNKNGSVLKKILEEGDPISSNVSDVENALAFMNSESSMKHKPIIPDLGVSISHQIDMSRESLIEGAKELGLADGSPELAAATAIIDQIDSATSKSDLSAIAVSGVPAKVGRYLNEITKKRVRETSYTEDELKNNIKGGATTASPEVSAISNAIATMNISDGDRIRKSIMENGGLTGDQKTAAVKSLDEQISSLDTHSRFEADMQTMSVVRENGYENFKKILDAISGSKGYLAKDVLELYNEQKFSGIQQPGVKSHLETKLKDKVLKNLRQELTDAKYGPSEEGVKNIVDFLRNITTLKENNLIGEVQYNDIMKESSLKINIAVHALIDNIKQQFAVPGKYNDTFLRTLLTQKYAGTGLKEFFELKTPESIKIEEDIKYMIGLQNIYGAISATVDGQELTEPNAESLAFSRIYFDKDKRNTGDQLFDSINRMSTFAVDDTNFPVTNVGDGPGDLEGSTFIDNMRKEIADIDGFADESDKYAALLILKKKCVAAYRTHSLKYFGVRNVSNYSSHMNTPANKADYRSQVYDLWVHGDAGSRTESDDSLGLLTLIDRKLLALSTNPNYVSSKSGAVAAADKFLGERTVQNIATGPSMY